MSSVSEGFKRWKTRDGWTICSVPWTCVPGYDLALATTGLGRDAIEREFLMNWNVVVGKKVYEEFDAKRHVASERLEFDPTRPLHCGWDWAWTGSPAFVPTQINTFGQWLVFPSLSPTPEQMSGIYQFAEDCADHLLRNYAAPHGLDLKDLDLVHIGDPAGRAKPPQTGERRKEQQSCFEILYRGLDMHMGLDENDRPVIEKKPGWGWIVIPGAVNITARLEAVRSRLTTTLRDGLPALVVDPRATTIIEGFAGSYAFKEFDDGTYSREPDKSYWSHCLSGETLIETERGHVRIDSVTTEDRVWTRKGWRRVRSAWCSGINRLYEVRLADGRTLNATSKHRIWTDRGWTAVVDLRYNNLCSEKRLSTTAFLSTAIRMPEMSLTGVTIKGPSTASERGCTRLFGKKRMGRFLLGIISTIRTATWTTIASIISSVSPRGNIAGLRRNWARTGRNENSSTSTRYVPWPLNGISRRKDANGIGSTATRLLLPLLSVASHAKSAAESSTLAFSTTGPVFAATTVLRRPVARAVWITRSETASDVGSGSPSIGTPELPTAPTGVIAVTRLPGLHLVYDLEIEGVHEFYANGILVANSMDALGYCGTRLFSRPASRKKEGEFDEDRPRQQEFRSQSSSFYRS